MSQIKPMKEFFRKNKEIILPTLPFLIVLIIFSRMVFNSFVYDDFLFTFNWVIKTIVNPFYYFSQAKTLEVYLAAQDVYRPLGTWFFALEYRLFGMSPFYFHLISLFLHALNTILLFFLLRKILSAARQNPPSAGDKNDLLAFFGSLIFAIHPTVPETVAWAIQQYSLWSWFFSFLALHILFSKKTGENLFLNKEWKRITLLAILGFLAVFFKEHAVIFPLIYVLCILTLKMDLKKRLGEIAAVTLPVIIYLLSRGLVLGTYSQMEPWAIGRYKIFLTMLKGLAYYFRLMIWPHPLSINYDSFPFAKSASEPSVILSAIFLLLIISAAVYFWRKQPLFSLGIFWIFIVMMPISNFVFTTKQVISERYLYFMLPGFIISLFPAVIFISEKLGNFKKFLIPLLTFIVTAIFLIFSSLTFVRLGNWKNDLALWRHEAEIKPDVWRTNSNYGFSLEKENRTKEAIEYYKKALVVIVNTTKEIIRSEKLSSNVSMSVGRLAEAYIRIGETKKAELLLRDTLKKFLPDDKALIYQLGQAYLEEKEYKKAEETFKRAAPDDILILFTALSKKLNGEMDEKIKAEITKMENAAFRQASFPLIKGRQKMLEGKYEEAIPLFEEVFSIRPLLPISKHYLWLGECFEKIGRKEMALEIYRLMLIVIPYSVDAAQGILRNGGTKEEVFLPFL